MQMGKMPVTDLLNYRMCDSNSIHELAVIALWYKKQRFPCNALSSIRGLNSTGKTMFILLRKLVNN